MSKLYNEVKDRNVYSDIDINKLTLIFNKLSLYFKSNFLNKLLNIFMIIKFEKKDPKNLDIK